MRSQQTWTDSETAILRGLWDTEMSCAEIGRAMGKTKNSVIGRAKRIGLKPRPSVVVISPAKRAERIARRAAEREKAKIAAQKQIEDYGKKLAGEGVRMQSGGCRWIEGDPSLRPDSIPLEAMHCRCKTYKGAMTDAYCETHYQRAYLKQKEKKEPGTCLGA